MFTNNYFANRYFAPVYFASLGADPVVGTIVPVYFRRCGFVYQWSFDRVTWFDGRPDRALFQLSALDTMDGPLARHNRYHTTFEWTRET